jgi:hypothetical protein
MIETTPIGQRPLLTVDDLLSIQAGWNGSPYTMHIERVYEGEL